MSSPSYPTPPPPSTSPAPAPISPESQQPGLSEAARLINVFVAPKKTFEDLRVNQSWWVPWLVGAVISVLFGIAVTQKVDMLRFTQQQMEKSKMAQRQMEQLPPEQKERVIERQAMVTKIAFYASPVFSLLGGLIAAAILMAIFSFGFGAEVPFPRAMAVVFYSFLPRALYAILLSLSLLFSSDPNSIDIAGNPMPTNAGFFMDPEGNKFLFSLISNIDVFALWTVILMGIGFATASSNRKLRPGTAVAVMLAVYGLLILVGAGFKAAF